MMKSTSDPFALAEQHGISFRIDDGRLQLSADTAPPPDVVTFLRAHRDVIVAKLNGNERCLICAINKPDGVEWTHAIRGRGNQRKAGFICLSAACWREFITEGMQP
jgi:hypothetical protein